VTIRTALVLGGTSDIAQAVLQQLSPSGLERAVLAVRDPGDLTALELPGVEVHGVAWDALDIGAHQDLVAVAAERLGQVDLVLCAVGLLGHHAGLGMAPEDVDRMVRTNFSGPAAALAAVADHLVAQGHGTIVVLSSVAGVRPRRSNFVYGSTKSGLDAYARGLGDALAGTGVRVLVVRPGFVRSRMTEGLEPAPFASTPEVVATAVARRLGPSGTAGRGGVLWVPPVLGPLFGVLANVPGALWRRIAGDR
jgi:decaprenylphospho-beta-D-erythro-pentofuranosid-2-ulose 2-reductase